MPTLFASQDRLLQLTNVQIFLQMQCGLMLKTRGPLIVEGSLESLIFDAVLCTTQTAVLLISVFAAVALCRKNTKTKMQKIKKKLSAMQKPTSSKVLPWSG